MDSEGKETTNEDKKEREKNKKRKHKNLSGSVICLHPKTATEVSLYNRKIITMVE